MKNQKATKAMKAAWTNSRKAAAKFGGKASQYFVECLKAAWEWVKGQSDLVCRIGTIVRETEKAVMVNVEVELINCTRTVGIWYPKSQIENGCVPAWLQNAKMKDLQERFSYIQGVKIL